MFEETYSNEQRAARTRQRIIVESACYEEIVTEKRRYLSCQTSVLDFFKTISETLLLDNADDDPDDPGRSVSSANCHLSVSSHFLLL
jgi:hypothetical protein